MSSVEALQQRIAELEIQIKLERELRQNQTAKNKPKHSQDFWDKIEDALGNGDFDYIKNLLNTNQLTMSDTAPIQRERSRPIDSISRPIETPFFNAEKALPAIAIAEIGSTIVIS